VVFNSATCAKLSVLIESIFMFNSMYCIVQMSNIVGFNLKPEENTPLSKMLEFGLTKHLDK